MALMNRMRENTKVILMILVVAFMLTIIIDWGMGGFKTGQKPGVIATVNGKDITYDEFKQMFDTELANYRERQGKEPTNYETTQLENQIYETLVQQRLMADVIKDFDLKATDAEITEAIWNNPPAIVRNLPAFQDSLGRFDEAQYQAILNNPDPQVADFWYGVEEYMRTALPMEKLNLMLTSGIQVTDQDALLEFQKNNSKAKINYIFFNANDYGDFTAPTDEEIQNYYSAHKDEYKEIEKRVLDYVLFETKTTAADTQSVIDMANDLIEELNDGGDFEQLVRLYSQDDATAEFDGNLGGEAEYFGKSDLIKPIADAVFSASEGAIVGPVKSNLGFHVIKVEDKRRRNGEQEAKAKQILLKVEVSPSTRNAMMEDAEYISNSAKEYGFTELAQAESLKVETTRPFEKGGFIPGLGMELRINNFAYRSKAGDVSGVFTLDRGYVVVSLSEIIPEHTKEVDEVRDRVISALNTEKRMGLAQAAAAKIYDKVTSGTSLETIEAQDSVTVAETDFFNMTGYVSKIGNEPELVGTAFGLEQGAFSNPIEGSRGYYIIQLVEKQDYDAEEFEKQKEDLKLQLAARYRQQVYSKWYAGVKEKANIKDFREFYF